MKKLWAMLVVVSLGMILAMSERASAALPCSAGCGGQKNACVQAARVAKLSCKQDCRTNADPTTLGACMRMCSGTFRSTKTGCQADLVSCLDTCEHPSSPPPSSCLGNCGKGQATCTQGVVKAARSCVAGCRSASDHVACLKGCTADAKQGAATCASDFQACRTSCSASPSGAFVD
jgi:hypothetical protein